MIYKFGDDAPFRAVERSGFDKTGKQCASLHGVDELGCAFGGRRGHLSEWSRSGTSPPSRLSGCTRGIVRCRSASVERVDGASWWT